MKQIVYFWMIALVLSLPTQQMAAQDQTQVHATTLDNQFRFMSDLELELYGYIQRVNDVSIIIKTSKKLKSLTQSEKDLAIIDSQWQLVTQSMMANIAETPELMNLFQQYQQLMEETKQAIADLKVKLNATKKFRAARKAILANIPQYAEWEKQAETLSLTPKTAPLLERLKAQEAVKIQEIDEQYQKAKQAAEQNSSGLKKSMKQLDEKYVDLKLQSDTIQGAKYIPFLDRIKDYLLSLAGVAIIIMFFTLLSTKIQSMKAAREQAEKYKQMLENNNQEIPTI